MIIMHLCIRFVLPGPKAVKLRILGCQEGKIRRVFQLLKLMIHTQTRAQTPFPLSGPFPRDELIIVTSIPHS